MPKRKGEDAGEGKEATKAPKMPTRASVRLAGSASKTTAATSAAKTTAAKSAAKTTAAKKPAEEIPKIKNAKARKENSPAENGDSDTKGTKTDGDPTVD